MGLPNKIVRGHSRGTSASSSFSPQVRRSEEGSSSWRGSKVAQCQANEEDR